MMEQINEQALAVTITDPNNSEPDYVDENAIGRKLLVKDSSVTKLSQQTAFYTPSLANEQHIESLRLVIREKDKEANTFLSIIDGLRRENNKLKQKDTTPIPLDDQLNHMSYKMEETEKFNRQLQAEVVALKRI